MYDVESMVTALSKITNSLGKLDSGTVWRGEKWKRETQSNVITRRCRVRMDDVESMAMALSKMTNSLGKLSLADAESGWTM